MIEQAARLRAEARAAGLEAQQGFWDAPDRELDGLWNGCGPDAWPADVRETMTGLYEEFQPEMLIHDYDFSVSDGTARGWRAADGRLGRNMRRTVRVRCAGLPWWRRPPARWWGLHRARWALSALRKFGFTFYKSAGASGKSDKETA